MRELRARFRESTAGRLDTMRAMLAALERDPADRASLSAIARHFHALSGMGATYGFPKISELGDRAEESVIPLAKNGGVPDRETLARWRSVVDEVAAELNASGLC